MAVALAGGMCTVAVISEGVSVLWTRCWGWYLLVFLTWRTLVHPHVILEETGVRIINPFRIHIIDYGAIEQIDARSFLSITRGHQKFQAWGAPIATQTMSDRHRNIMADATLPGARYGGHSLTAVDLSASGLAGEIARQLAGHIMELEAAHMMDSSNSQTRSRWNIIPIVTVLILLVLTVWAWLG